MTLSSAVVDVHVYLALQILTPFLVRRLKTDVEFSLPPKKEVLVYAPLTAYQEKYYKSPLNNIIFDMMEKEEKKKLAEMAKKGKENVFGVEKMECDDFLKEREKSDQENLRLSECSATFYCMCLLYVQV